MLQINQDVYLIQDGKTLTKVGLGDRYKTTICSSGEYEFVVKKNPNDVTISARTIDVSEGKNHYLKIALPIGIELPIINEVKRSKGERDVKKGSKFTSQLKTISITAKSPSFAQQQPIPSGFPSTHSSQGNQNTTTINSFQRTQIVNNFKYEVVNMEKAGGLFVMYFKITNLSIDDRYLSLCPAMTHFYDDLGNLVFPSEMCILNSCLETGYYHKVGAVRNTFLCYRSAGGTLPSNIPINAKITFKDINKRAKHFIRGMSWMEAEQDFKVHFGQIVFPSILDPINTNKRIMGEQSIELKKATKIGEEVYFHFRLRNNSADNYKLIVEDGTLWDDQGNEHKIDGASFVTRNQMTSSKYGYSKDINGRSTLDVYFRSTDVSTSVTQIKRITVKFKGFELSWKDIDVVR